MLNELLFFSDKSCWKKTKNISISQVSQLFENWSFFEDFILRDAVISFECVKLRKYSYEVYIVGVCIRVDGAHTEHILESFLVSMLILDNLVYIKRTLKWDIQRLLSVINTCFCVNASLITYNVQMKKEFWWLIFI